MRWVYFKQLSLPSARGTRWLSLALHHKTLVGFLEVKAREVWGLPWDSSPGVSLRLNTSPHSARSNSSNSPWSVPTSLRLSWLPLPKWGSSPRQQENPPSCSEWPLTSGAQWQLYVLWLQKPALPFQRNGILQGCSECTFSHGVHSSCTCYQHSGRRTPLVVQWLRTHLPMRGTQGLIPGLGR